MKYLQINHRFDWKLNHKLKKPSAFCLSSNVYWRSVSATTISNIRSKSIKLHDVIGFLCFWRSVSDGSHVESGSFQMVISCSVHMYQIITVCQIYWCVSRGWWNMLVTETNRYEQKHYHLLLPFRQAQKDQCYICSCILWFWAQNIYGLTTS